MINGSKGIFIGCTAQVVFVRVVGRGTFQNSQPLRRHAMELLEGGRTDFVIDLEQCAGMDSTFLGVMAGIALRLRQNNLPGSVRIVHASSRCRELLQSIGLDRLFTIAGGTGDLTAISLPAGTEFQCLPEADHSPMGKQLDDLEAARVMLEAHQDLVRADRRNESKFANVTSVLREQIDRKSKETKLDP